ncbi:TPA: GNAT family N-acetyltransferase [Legionella pneumophila]|nr:GNAT family N-acetyltransferase [Legionella pneumophila]HAT8869214.1 GNAT family N-acetyltransferase [Legionella pneumophila subsp. pneumophila]HAT8642975.1 GNAT family N-acetyltransferase [Legionella pneumophila]HAT8891265.1 GNAT family N-acetyltransferase [Legionella pneumophila subsp. pneumophila]HAT8932218.1 GNAT family N-acetyltransferase [Legionella pneumophila subsp. pneumophila]
MSVKNQKNLLITPANLADYPTIQNLARFYVYEMSGECGLKSSDWACPADGLYESFDFKHYFTEPNRKAYIVKVDEEIAGFVLLYQTDMQSNAKWNMGEFFILARFQRRGIGQLVAQQIWQAHPGFWEVTVIPENKRALQFWRKAIRSAVNSNFVEEIKLKEGRADPDQPYRIFFTFDTAITETFPDKSGIRSATLEDTIASVQSIQTAQHFNWGDACDGWWLHQNEKFTVISERMPSNTAEKQHYHQYTDQFFYCLEGELCIHMPNNEYTLKAHEGLFIPATTVHKVKNRSIRDVQFLVFSSPNAHHDRFEN